MFSIGDYVTRKSYGNDIVFKIIGIQGNDCILKGVCIRLYADSPMEDLKKHTDDVVEDDIEFELEDYMTLDRNEYFYLPGKVLHIDADCFL